MPRILHSTLKGKDGAMELLREADLLPDPIEQFRRWHEEAGTDEMAVATVTPDGTPACRMVLLKEHGVEGFVFYTDKRSDKAIDLAARPQAALLFRWPPVRQVRAWGTVSLVSESHTERYWRTRPRESQLSAWASPQSRPVQSRRQLEDEVERLRGEFAGSEVPCPPFWGGFRVLAHKLEFWQQGPNRLHDRFVFELSPQGWLRQRLGP